MRVLFLGEADSPTAAYLREAGEAVKATADPITPDELSRFDFAVSHGYRHILRQSVIDALPDRIVNLHIAYLPYNRGADPNLWSWVEDTPKGVTIHHIDSGIDTGDVIAQRLVEFDGTETLASSYARLQDEMVSLFHEQWPLIRAGTAPRTPQEGEGTYHRVADNNFDLPQGWHTPVMACRPRR